MERRTVRLPAPSSVPGSQTLIETAFDQIRQLGTTEAPSNLFPNGIGSLELTLGNGPEGNQTISLKISGVAGQPIQSAPTEDEPIMLEGDVEATFNAEGHHTIALIAQLDLTLNFPATMKKVQKILDDGGRDLTAAATFPDDIRNTHPETKPFHFVDIPFRDGGPTNPALPPVPHVISKIADFSAALKQTTGGPLKRVDNLSWLIHLFGDIHQPLHCIEHFSELHPGGDRGGNSFRLKGKAKNLHSVWDSSVDFTNEPNEFQLAQSIVNEHSRDSLKSDLKITNVEDWARASFNLAKKFAYAPLHEDPAAPPTPSKAYLKKAQEIGRRQAALAGYRLADRLRKLL